MANIANIRGFYPVQSLTGGPGSVRRYAALAADGTAIGRGDFVTAQGTAGAPTDYGSALGIPVVAQSATGGVLEGGAMNYRAASVLASVWVETDPNQIYLGRVNGAANAIANTDAGLNADFVVAAANTTTGHSQMQINGATEATTNTLDLKLLRFEPYAGNDDSLANPHWYVRINRHRLVDQVAGV